MTNAGYKLRRGVGLYAVGFLVTQEQMAAIANLACPSFIALHGKDGVLALKWHVSRHKFEVLDTVKTDTYFIAVHFYPWPAGRDRKDPPPSLKDMPQDRRDLWQDTYGRHALGTCKEVSYLYPTCIGSPYFLSDYLEKVVVARRLWDVLEPISILEPINPI
ncbi:hypothetical protein B0H12DRAFT_1162810 [Mycena haematopus]|nr:hypothetical protein B0H12DRAFT_1162810 [Mycena haematopus]